MIGHPTWSEATNQVQMKSRGKTVHSKEQLKSKGVPACNKKQTLHRLQLNFQKFQNPKTKSLSKSNILNPHIPPLSTTLHLSVNHTLDLHTVRNMAIPSPSYSLATKEPASGSTTYCRKQKSLGLLCSKYYACSIAWNLHSDLWIYNLANHVHVLLCIVSWACTIEMELKLLDWTTQHQD